VAGKKPEIRCDIELTDHVALAERAAIDRNFGDPVHHQHGRDRQLGVAGAEIAALAGFEQVFLRVGRFGRVIIVRSGHVRLSLNVNKRCVEGRTARLVNS